MNFYHVKILIILYLSFQNMENIDKIKNNIETFISSSNKYNIKKEDNTIELKRIGGYSNFNYYGIIKNKSTNEIIENIFYREYGSKFEAISNSINHEDEIKITKLLAEKEYGPKVLFELKDNFCIREFLTNTKNLPIEKYYDKNIIEQLCTILNYFTTFSYVYKYEININNNDIKLIPIKNINNNDNNKKINLTKNQYQKSMGELYDTAEKCFKNFYDKFKLKYTKEKNINEFNDIELVKYNLENFKKIYNENSYLKGFFVINHNDVLSVNILYREKDEKIFLIDHEYFILNLPGHDIAYYLAESFIKLEPIYSCDLEKVNFNNLFLIYEVFINKFIENHRFIENEEYGKEFMEIIKTKKYFIKLMNAVNLYMFIWSIGNINFDNWEKGAKKEFFLVHGIDRLKFYLLGMKMLEQMNN